MLKKSWNPSLCPSRSTLYCPLDDQRPLKKQAFWLKSINNAYYYKLRQLLQIMTIVTNYSRTIKISVCKTKEQNRPHNSLDSDFDFGFVKSTGLLRNGLRGVCLWFLKATNTWRKMTCEWALIKFLWSTF